MYKVVELKQEREYMRPNFEGYKLSLEPIVMLRRELILAPLKAEPTDEQYSFLHAELFSMQNLLQVDPWARTQAYFININEEIIKCVYDENKGRSEDLQVVYHLGNTESTKDGCSTVRKKKGEYNHTFRFISEKYCVLCDGVKTLYLFETGDRLKAVEWKQVAICNIEGESLPKEEINYVIYDSRLDILNERKQISLILGHVEKVESLENECVLTTHFLYLHWCRWSLEEQSWKFSILETLEGKGSLYYCAFEPRAESVVISSNHEFLWRSKKFSKKDDEVQLENAELEEKPQLHGDSGETDEITGFTWTQTDKDLVIKFKIIPGKNENDYNVISLESKIIVQCNDEKLLDYDLFNKIDVDLTAWNIENNILQITLIKHTSGLLWTSLLANGAGPKETKNINVENILNMEKQPIVNLESPIEDCDFPMELIDDEIKISRFNFPSKSVTHAIIMGSTPPLFATSLRPGFPLALATRQDVDCCLWVQHYNATKPDEWSMRHEGNLHAFGYIQASKQQRKFMDCSPDLGYALIAESYHHVFIYKSTYNTAEGLRNRSGSPVEIGKQHLLTLKYAGEILGMTTANNVAILLTKKCVIFLKM